MVTIKDQLVDLEKVCSGIQDMLKEAWKLLYQLTGGKRFATNLPEHFTDDLLNDTRGYFPQSWPFH